MKRSHVERSASRDVGGLGKTKTRLRSLLRYTDELLSFNEKVAFDLADEPYPHFHEQQVARLEGVETSTDSENWLRIKRLRESRPPNCDTVFDGWINFGTHPSADQPPKLAAERLINMSIGEVSELAEAGFLPDTRDVMRPVGADEAMPDRMDVILRSANMPEFAGLWREYVEGPWTEWAKTERPRRSSIDFYNKVYQIYQRMIALGDDTPIELVFGVGVARWQCNGHRINLPLIEQLAEIELEATGALLVRPRNLPPQLVLKAFHALEVEGSKAVQRDIGEQLEKIVDDPDVGFSPLDKRSFETVLRACAARLSPTGIYHPDTLVDADDRTLPNADALLRVTNTWVIYVRQRSGDFRRDDIARLIKRVEEVEDEDELPAPGVRFVTEPSDEVIVHPGDDLIDLGNRMLILPEHEAKSRPPDSHGGVGDGSGEHVDDAAFFFPLPFNDDQKDIIRRLEADESDGIVVQGPPGTGKTHTIANIICHFLATKRRVLVTAKTPEALRALQEKIPEGIRVLVPEFTHIVGYSRFSLTRASAVVNCQSAFAWCLLRLSCHAATSSIKVCLLAMRRSRH